MEPVAPGTEDEVPVTLPAFSKKEKEQERLLSIKAVLPNGQYGNVFELSYVNHSEHWYCNLCECPVMGRVYYHENGNRHNHSVNNSKKRERGGRAPLQAEAPTPQVAPGEPVPPGFEKEIVKPTLIQERLDAFTVSPLIGLEYLLEIQEYDRDKEPSYLCMLCDKRGDPRTVLAHLVSYNHITQYMQRHFVKVYRALAPYSTKQYKKNWQDMVNKIAEAIELRYGRLKPHPVVKEGFEEVKAEYWQMIFHGPHFSDKNGVTFEELVVREELTKSNEDLPSLNIQKPSEDVAKRTYRKTGSVPGAGEPSKKRSPSPPVVAKPVKKAKSAAPIANRDIRRSLSSVSSISSSDLSDYEPEKKKPPRYNRSRSRSPYKKGKFQRRLPSPRTTYRDKPGELPWQRPDYIKSRNDLVPDRSKTKTDKFDEYRKLANAIETDMEKTLKQHKKNPEKHPQYNDEWKKFWNKRYKELQGEGKDAANHDFKPEWIIFWNKRMNELHHSEVKTKKDALRKRLGLPDEPAPICFRITGKKKPNGNSDAKSNKPAPMASEPDQDHEVIVIEDKDDDTLSSKRSHSPWESEPTRPSSRVSRDKSRDREHSYERRSRERSYERRSRERSYERRGDYKYRSPERRYRREKSRDSEYRSYMREKSWERDGPYRDYRRDIPDCYKPPPVMRDVTRQPVFIPTSAADLEPEEDDSGDINVVAVLRLLTALEEKLGSLGPKIIDMLAQALALEKNEANSSESLLENDINCVLFETVKEKLKGQLLAGLVDYAQEKAFKNAIKKIASLMHFANGLKTRKRKDKPKVDPVKVPGVGTVDKAAIAKQIANALISQGKTDVTQDELEQLINAVVGMAEASKSSGKPITTAGFIEKLNVPRKVSPKREKQDQAEEFPIKIETPPPSVTSAGGPSISSSDASANMEGLSDSDLQTLLQNFKDLSTEEQHGLITYLKKLEAKEPERVERLRKFVNLGSGQSVEKPSQLKSPKGNVGGNKEGGQRAFSPFSIRLAGTNPTVEENNLHFDDDDDDDDDGDEKEETAPPKKEQSKIKIDSDDEDYSYEDVFKVAKQKVTEKELEKERKLVEDTIKREPKTQQVDLSDAKALIANIMENINRKDTAPNLLGLQNIKSANHPRAPDTIPVSAANIVSALGLGTLPVNVSNLADIVGNIQSMEQKNAPAAVNAEKPPPQSPKPTFPPQNLPQRPNPNFYPVQNPSFPQNPRNPPPFQPQNVQYPLKNPYGNYSQSVGGYPQNQNTTAYPNQGAYGRGPPPPNNNPYNRFNNPDFNNRSGNNMFNNRPGGNYGGNRW